MTYEELEERHEQLRQDAADNAARVFVLMAQIDELTMELADVRRFLKISQMHVSEWQEKYKKLAAQRPTDA